MKRQRQDADFQVVPYPKYQRWMAAGYRWSAQHRHMIHALFEADVTRARAALRTHRAQTGEALSFTAFLIACLARAVDEHKAVQAYRQRGKRLVLFDDVDVLTNIEHDVGGQKYVIPHPIRAANRKTIHELHHEIRAAQRADVSSNLKGFLPLRLPTMLFRPFLWAFGWIGGRRPRLWKMVAGTVGITSVGMFGTGTGWGIPPAAPPTLMLTVGGIGERQVVVDGHAAARESLSLTVSVDHDVVDGAPAARFVRRLKDLIESGYGLDDLTAMAAAAAEPAGAEGASPTLAEAMHA